MYLLQSLPSPPQSLFDSYVKHVTNFIWEGKKSKISYKRLTSGYGEGGLRLRDLKRVDSSLKAAKFQVVKRNKYFWTHYFLNKFDMNAKEIDELNFCQRDVRKNMEPSVFTDILYHWAKFNFHSPKDFIDILNQPIWFNSHVKKQGKWVFNKTLAEAGVFKISHIYNLDYGRFDTYDEFEELNGKIIDFVTYYGLIKIIPTAWKNILQQSVIVHDKPVPWHIKFHNTKIKKTKLCYDTLEKDNAISNTGLLTAWNVDLGTNFTSKEFSGFFIKAKQISLCTKHWFFQYRILTRSLSTNFRVSKWKTDVSPYCTFCGKNNETTIHLFFECELVQKRIWKPLCKWINHFHSISINISVEIVICNNFKGRLSKLINTYILIAKFYLYRAKTQNANVSFTNFVTDLVRHKNIEKCIALKNDKLYKFARKWDDFSVFD